MRSVSWQRSNLGVAAALVLVLFAQSVGGATPQDELSFTRASAIRSAVSGCMAAVIDPAVIGYMQRAAQVGNPFSSETEARADMTGNPKWKTEIEPMIRTACECAMKPAIEGIQAAESVGAIQKIVFDLEKRLGDPTTAEAEAAKFERCVQPLVQKLGKKK